MGLINGVPHVNPNVKYDGKTLPQDAAPLADPPIDTDVQYGGKTLPAQKTQIFALTVDPTNNPPWIRLIRGSQTIILPTSTNITLSGKKILAESQIIDGVSVFEHISRKPYEIEFKIVIYDDSFNPVFPQAQINDIFNNAWLPNTVLKVKNTYLNGLGVQEIIMDSIKPQPRLGSKVVDMVIKAFENQPGQTIIMPNIINTEADI